jgi:hypothetical protein
VAGPSLIVKLLGDVTGLGKSFSDAGTKGASAASGIHSAFSSMLGQLNSTGVLGPFGTALETANGSLEKMGGHAKNTSDKMIGLGGAALGVGLSLSTLGSKDQAAHQQLQASITASGHSYDQFSGKIDEAVKHQEKFGHTADETQNAMQTLTQATHNPTEALKLMNTASDLAAAKHEDLNTAATQLGKAYNGSAKIMKEFGITTTAATAPAKELAKATKSAETADTTLSKAKRTLTELEVADSAKKKLTTLDALHLQDAQNKVADATTNAAGAHQVLRKAEDDNRNAAKLHEKALDELGGKLKGQASASANTFTGHLKDMRAVVTDQISQFGQKYGKAIATGGAALAGFGSAMKGAEAATKALKDSQLIQSAVTKTATAIQWLFNAAMDANPILIVVIAIIAIIAILVLLATHFKIIRDAVDDVWKFIKKAWDDILGIFQGVFNWIAANWPLLLGILTGPFGLAVFMIVTYWNSIVSFFSGIPGKITAAIGDVTNLLYDVGKTIINSLWRGMKDIWNNLTGWIGGLASHLPGFIKGPLGIHSPSTVFLAMGNDIMKGLGQGMAVGFNQHVQPALNATVAALTPTRGGGVSAGGALSPAMASSASGPAVVVNNAHFSSGVDVDSFMRRAAWVARNRL